MEVHLGPIRLALEMYGAKDAAEFTQAGAWDLSPNGSPTAGLSADKIREVMETALREGYVFFECTHRRLDGVEFPGTLLITRMEMAGQAFLQVTVPRHYRPEAGRGAHREDAQCGSAASAGFGSPLLTRPRWRTTPEGYRTPSSALFDADFLPHLADPARRSVRNGAAYRPRYRGGRILPAPRRCLHLVASSGRYTHIDGPGHRRCSIRVLQDRAPGIGRRRQVPYPTTSPTIRMFHDRAWAREAGAGVVRGIQLRNARGRDAGVLALFSKHPILPRKSALLEGLGTTVALLVKRAVTEEALLRRTEELQVPTRNWRQELAGPEGGKECGRKNNILSESQRMPTIASWNWIWRRRIRVDAET